MATNYKAMKEAFVSNLTGSSVWEVNRVTLVAPSAVILWSALQARQKLFTPYTAPAYLIDFLLNCGALLFATTLYSSAPLLLNILLLLPAILVCFSSVTGPKQQRSKPSTTANPSAQDALPFKPFVTHYRGSMMVITCIAILAVDFRVFPRRFAKVETWGTSLMDMGVGSFVFAAGTVSARGIIRERMTKAQRPSLSKRLAASARHSFPLLLLGLIRLYSVKGLDYAEHVTEYGVHWNFFFTLGLLPPFVALFQSILSIVPSYAVLSILLCGVYQACLDFTDLKAYILTAARIGFLSKNREGIFSLIGYLSIFLAGQATGVYVLPREEPIHKDTPKFQALKKSVLGKLMVWTFIWSALFTFTTSFYGLGLPVSRRLANLPYFLWVCAFNCFQLLLFAATERICFPDLYNLSNPAIEQQRCKNATSRILYAFNRNGLAVFLLGNLLTGLVNLTMPTLTMKALETMAVLIGYVSVLANVAIGLDARNISIKL